ncbi:MAG: phosphatidylserine/phosphatidylglycerophosphate/cardiolipin synthase family protein [Saprospiraceae bacterium]|nr:phosphatidylserine/phosphatidylglycerophosphate/cardiolipin synthase family protein [Saprospiraceae bacterium]
MAKNTLLFLMLVLLIAPKANADVFRILEDETEALQCRIDLIEQAKSEILLSYYILNDDLVGMTLFSALIEATQKRGVKVCLFVDGVNSKISNPVMRYLEEQGIEVRVFKPGNILQPISYAKRMHNKLFITDNMNIIVGGRNIKREYYSLGKEFNFLDRDVFVNSAEASITARKHFYSIWNNRKIAFDRDLDPINDEKRSEIEKKLSFSRILIQQLKEIKFNSQIDWTLNQKPTDTHPVFEHDNFHIFKFGKRVDVDYKDEGSTKGLLKMVNQAQKSILMENAYVIPTTKWRKALKRAIQRGVKIRIMTNSTQTSDVMLAQAAYRNARGRLIKMGIEVWEYQGPKTLHTKSTVIDDSISIVSSYNLVSFAERWSTEVAVWVADTTLAKQHKLLMEENLKSAIRIDKHNKQVVSEIPDAKKLTCKKKMSLFFSRYTFAWVMRLL